ncbi:MAG: shikimate kinase [Syntrophales bacterium]|jgi:shikimate kinase|nr:shikimate kinase [Syntrophales bacterium]MDD4338404.1 shikimate kinase [Syntrophales bacterium]HOG06832.1 shikimate kinase [Syntrophales bacterium]HQN26453.1 shikimate kinase [Syntrophales bacterium]
MKNVVLAGYRCTGKTSVGRGLAARLHRPFYDTDDLVRERTGMSVRRIVAEQGWASFRSAERAVIADLAFLKGAVVALGGGVVLDPENVAAVKANGRVIWLVADARTIVARMGEDPVSATQRPSLRGVDRLKETVQILAERTPVYRAAADFTVDTTGKTVDEIAAEIGGFLARSPDATPPDGTDPCGS